MSLWASIRRWGLRVTLHNLRWECAYRLGGFTHAWNYGPDELRYCEACGNDVPRLD